MTPDPYPAIRHELQWIVGRFAAADDALLRAKDIPDRNEAEQARRQAIGDYERYTADCGDLFVLLLRAALRHRGGALRLALVELLKDELLKEMAPAVARLVAATNGHNGKAGTNGRHS